MPGGSALSATPSTWRRAALDRGDIDGGWRAVHEGQRFVIFGLTGPEIVARAVSLRAETHAKLRGWRYRATEVLWNSLKLTEWQKAAASLKDEERGAARTGHGRVAQGAQ